MTREQLEIIRLHGRLMGHREAEHRFCPGGNLETCTCADAIQWRRELAKSERAIRRALDADNALELTSDMP